MRSNATRTRRAGLMAAATALAAIVGVSAVAAPAQAAPTTYQNNLRVENKLASLPAAVYNDWFRYLDDRDGLLGAQALPYNAAFQWYNGNVGPGGIYVHQRFDTTYTAAIYGSIFASWKERGYEHVMGFPRYDEQGPVSQCPAGTLRSQQFLKPETGVRYACWNWQWTGLPHGVYWTS